MMDVWAGDERWGTASCEDNAGPERGELSEHRPRLRDILRLRSSSDERGQWSRRDLGQSEERYRQQHPETTQQQVLYGNFIFKNVGSLILKDLVFIV